MLAGDHAMAESLSWAPGGKLLTYIPGSDETGGGFAGDGAVPLDTAAPGTVASSASNWPPFLKHKGQCQLRSGTWQGSSGSATYIALEQCNASVVVVAANDATGATESPAVPLPGGLNTPYWGCGQPLLDTGPSASDVLISGCGLYLYSHGRIRPVAGPLAGATAWSGS